MSVYADLLHSFTESEQDSLLALFSRYRLTLSEKLEFLKAKADIRQWDEKRIEEIINWNEIDQYPQARQRDALLKSMRTYLSTLRESETDYHGFTAPLIHRNTVKAVIETDEKTRLIGICPCPVDGEKTRCCKLSTLDAVSQCSFGCSYCSVQSFYHKGQITVVGNLAKRLDALELDPSIWHIGTGQASDSLLWGDTYGTLSALSAFGRKHPNVVIELKSKSNRSDYLSLDLSPNLLFSWSLNAETIVEKEEHLTASLEERIAIARKVADTNHKVGFHIHPMVYFKGWQDEYRHVVDLIVENFAPEELCMISIGTLTFTKSVLQSLRLDGRKSRVLEMPLEEAAGKFSYPLDIKKEMFSFVFQCFPKSYQQNVFFYLCMEDPSLWLPVLGREYPSDQAFSDDMKSHYLRSIGSLAP